MTTPGPRPRPAGITKHAVSIIKAASKTAGLNTPLIIFLISTSFGPKASLLISPSLLFISRLQVAHNGSQALDLPFLFNVNKCNPRLLYHLYHSRMAMSNIHLIIGNYPLSITTPLLSPLLLFLKMRYFYAIELEVDQTLFLKIFV